MLAPKLCTAETTNEDKKASLWSKHANDKNEQEFRNDGEDESEIVRRRMWATDEHQNYGHGLWQPTICVELPRDWPEGGICTHALNVRKTKMAKSKEYEKGKGEKKDERHKQSPARPGSPKDKSDKSGDEFEKPQNKQDTWLRGV